MHALNLSSFSIYTDLIEDVVSSDEEIKSEEVSHFVGGKVTRVSLNESQAKKIGKKAGVYTTISFQDVTDETFQKAIEEALYKEILFYFEKFSLKKEATCLVLGLGNRESTPDALGPKSLSELTITRHLFLLNLDVDQKYHSLAAVAPGVMAQTGIETQEYLCSLIGTVRPDLVIAIDALASSSLERVMKTIQLTDTGIHPGSGIGNYRKEISKETIHTPVLAIGVPTVVSAATIVQNTLTYLNQKISYQKENGMRPKSKFLTGFENTYEKQEDILSSEEKEELLGEVGKLSFLEQQKLFEEVLTPLGYNLIVTPTEVDFQIEHLAAIIGKSVDRAFHEKR